jgi:nitrogen fixation-related uncharacterized protein
MGVMTFIGIVGASICIGALIADVLFWCFDHYPEEVL